MKIGIVSRSDMDEAVNLTEKILKHLSEEEVFLAPEIAKVLGEEGTPVEEMDIDSLVTIGGDGTVLRNLQKLPEIPILGINMGGRGFLADVNPEEATSVIDKMINGELGLRERERLSIKISEGWNSIALNEGVVRSEEPSGIISFEVFMDGELVEKIEGDGLIVSTPTGSTAYALASGGPILHPDVEAFLAVTLSTYRPRAFPLVFPMSSELKVKLLEPNKKAYVTVDGQITKELKGGGCYNL